MHSYNNPSLQPFPLYKHLFIHLSSAELMSSTSHSESCRNQWFFLIFGSCGYCVSHRSCPHVFPSTLGAPWQHSGPVSYCSLTPCSLCSHLPCMSHTNTAFTRRTNFWFKFRPYNFGDVQRKWKQGKKRRRSFVTEPGEWCLLLYEE